MSGSIGDNVYRASGVVASAGGGGSWNLLDTQTVASAATMDFTSSIDSTYRYYAILISNMVPAGDENLNVQISQDAGSTWLGSSGYEYEYNTHGENAGAATTVYALASTSAGSCKITNQLISAGDTCSAELLIDNPSGTSYEKMLWGSCNFWNNSNVMGTCNFGIVYKGTSGTPLAALNGVRFLMSGGDITSGVGKLYGIS